MEGVQGRVMSRSKFPRGLPHFKRGSVEYNGFLSWQVSVGQNDNLYFRHNSGIGFVLSRNVIRQC